MSVAPGTLITTSKGLMPVEALTTAPFKVWTGQRYEEALAYSAGVEPVARVKLANGLSALVSPSQALAVVPSESALGAPLWREQRALKAGDRVLMGYKREDTLLDTDLLGCGYRDRATLEDPGIWHLLGYALGSGYFPGAPPSTESFSVFAYNRLDEPLLEDFAATCDAHFIPAMATEGDHAMLSIHDRDFHRWLRDLGFQSAAEGQSIPNRFFQAPAWIRAALLRGLFASASKWDETYNAPVLYLHNPTLRQSALRCLWSIGVAAHEKQSDTVDHKIRVSDVDAWLDSVGDLQDGVPREAARVPGYENRWDVLPVSTAQTVIRAMMVSPVWKTLTGDEREKIVRLERRGLAIRRPLAIEYLRKVHAEVPDALHYHHAKVGMVDVEPIHRALMYRVEVANEAALFLANHIAMGDSRAVL